MCSWSPLSLDLGELGVPNRDRGVSWIFAPADGALRALEYGSRIAIDARGRVLKIANLRFVSRYCAA